MFISCLTVEAIINLGNNLDVTYLGNNFDINNLCNNLEYYQFR